MRTSAAAFFLAAAAGASAAPAPHCEFAHEPVVLCQSATNAAAAWHLYGFSRAGVADSNNRALIRQAQCTVGSSGMRRHKVLENETGRIATQWGWTRVALITIDGRDLYYVAGPYLTGTCERFSTAGARRDERPRTPYDPTPFTPASSPDSEAPVFVETPIGKIGVPGNTFP